MVLHRDGFVPRAHLTMSRDTSVRKGGGCWGDQYWHLVGRGQMLLDIRQAPNINDLVPMSPVPCGEARNQQNEAVGAQCPPLLLIRAYGKNKTKERPWISGM